MKKVVIPVVALLLAGILFISLPIYKRYRVSGFIREFNNIHMLSWSQLTPYYVRAESDQGVYALTDGNLSYCSAALTREAQMVYRFFRPDLSALPCVTLTFPDGCELVVANGGQRDDGRDISYIVCSYQGKTSTYSITGFGVYDRVYACSSPEGFGSMGENTPLDH